MTNFNTNTNNLESEGTDSDVSATDFRKKHLSRNTLVFTLLMLTFLQSANANQLHLFSDKSGAVVGTLTSNSANPIMIEGFIENNILEAIEVIPTTLNYLNNGAGSGGLATDANSDGTGGSVPDANSDGTGGTSPDANSDGTGQKLLSVLIACDTESYSTALIETSAGTETLVIQTVYLNKEQYLCN